MLMIEQQPGGAVRIHTSLKGIVPEEHENGFGSTDFPQTPDCRPRTCAKLMACITRDLSKSISPWIADWFHRC